MIRAAALSSSSLRCFGAAALAALTAMMLGACSSGEPAGTRATGTGAAPGAPSLAGEASTPSAPDAPSETSNGTPEQQPAELPLDMPLTGVDSTLFVSDLCAALGETNGWGPVERDLSNGEDAAGDGGPIAIGNVLYGKGLGIHAPADVGLALDGRCTRFSAAVGVDDEMKGAGSVAFQVWGDGALLAQSRVLTGDDAAETLDVDVTGIDELRLVADPGDGNGSDHADWADARLTCTSALDATCPRARLPVPEYDGYRLAWADEFDVDGAPSEENWSFERGFVRNEEAQWYQPENASVRSGFLIIEGRRERVDNPSYRPGSGDWKQSRQFAEYTSSSLHGRGKRSFRFGRLEMRGRFPAHDGLWPAWWTLGNDGEWPWNGEVDILEFYRGALHANFVVGTNTRWEGNWDAVATPLAQLGDADWDARFHDYRMEWDDQTIVLTVDGRELNRMSLAELQNPDGQSPFLGPAYMLLNLAIGGQAAGDASAVPFPVRYEVDYVRVYERE